MERVNEARFEQLCAHLQQFGIAKVSFQTYWYGDEEPIDEEHCFGKNEQELAWPESLSVLDLCDLVPQGEEQFGRFELYTLEKRLVRLGAARPAGLEDIYDEEEVFDGGRDTETIEQVYALLHAAAISTLTLQSYWYRGLHEIVAVHCFDEQGQEVALPAALSGYSSANCMEKPHYAPIPSLWWKLRAMLATLPGKSRAFPQGLPRIRLSESDLRVVVKEAPRRFGHLKLLVNERRWLFLRALSASELGLKPREPFEGGASAEVDA